MNTEKKPDAMASDTPRSDSARTLALSIIRAKVEVRPFDEHNEKDGNHNFVHRMDAIAAVDAAVKYARQLERELNEAKAYSIEWQRKATAEMVAYENQLSTLRREKAELWAALEEMHKCFFDPAENEPKPGTWGAAACDKATAILAATKEKEEGK